MWLLFFFVFYSHYSFFFFLPKKVSICNVLFINGLHAPPSSSILPPHLAVVFHPARWIDEGVKGGRDPFISFGDWYRHMKQLVCSKNQL